MTKFYTAPTALRALMVKGEPNPTLTLPLTRPLTLTLTLPLTLTLTLTLMVKGEEPVNKCDLSSLKLLGSVGEILNPEAWRWYHRVVGKGKLPIVDTWWQSETGGIMISPLPGVHGLKPGSAMAPFFGCNPKIINPMTGIECKRGETGFLVLTQGWPGMMRTVYGDHARFVKTYFSQYPGWYFTGDGARIDEDGHVWVTGRIDDVLNVSGHRLSTAEVENALVNHDDVCEAAVVGIPHKIKGEGIYCYVTLEGGREASDSLRKDLIAFVRKEIGAIATPDHIHFTQSLPKTRSGKIMRRILRKVSKGEVDDLGDTSTLADPSVVEHLIKGRQA